MNRKVQYECKKCENEFIATVPRLGGIRCPKCGSKHLWITRGLAKPIIWVLAIPTVLLTLAFLLSFIVFFGAAIGYVVAMPWAVWTVIKNRKPGVRSGNQIKFCINCGARLLIKTELCHQCRTTQPT